MTVAKKPITDERRDRPAAEPKPSKDRPGSGEHERDVLTGHGEQVREPGGFEPPVGRVVDAAPVTDDEPEVEPFGLPRAAPRAPAASVRCTQFAARCTGLAGADP